MSEEESEYVHPGEHVYDGIVFNCGFPKEVIERCRALETSIEDVMVATYSKSGTTWTQNIFTHIFPELCDQEKNIGINVPFLEMIYKSPEDDDPSKPANGVELVEKRTPPRIYKTHLPGRYFKKKIEANKLKVIFVVRNIRDMLVSFYHHYKLIVFFFEYNRPWDHFFGMFKEKRLLGGDYKDIVREYLELCKHPNVLLVKYEDLKADSVKEIRRMVKFCGKNCTEEEIKKIASATSFEALKKNPNSNPIPEALPQAENFFRKGIVGDGVSYFSEEQLAFLKEYLSDFPEYFQLYPSEKEILS